MQKITLIKTKYMSQEDEKKNVISGCLLLALGHIQMNMWLQQATSTLLQIYTNMQLIEFHCAVGFIH